MSALTIMVIKIHQIVREVSPALRWFCRNILFQSFSYGDYSHRSGDTDVQRQAFRSVGDPALRQIAYISASEIWRR
jgi:hypothetical protein